MTGVLVLRGRRGAIRGFALVDAWDAFFLPSSRFYLDSTGYPATGRHTRLHRLLVPDLAPGEMVDHINGDRLDNRRKNLRRVTHAQNVQNVPGHGQSGYRGVYLDRRDGAWYGQVKHKGKRHSTSRFATAEDAAAAVEVLRSELLPFAVSRGGRKAAACAPRLVLPPWTRLQAAPGRACPTG